MRTLDEKKKIPPLPGVPRPDERGMSSRPGGSSVADLAFLFVSRVNVAVITESARRDGSAERSWTSAGTYSFSVCNHSRQGRQRLQRFGLPSASCLPRISLISKASTRSFLPFVPFSLFSRSLILGPSAVCLSDPSSCGGCHTPSRRPSASLSSLLACSVSYIASSTLADLLHSNHRLRYASSPPGCPRTRSSHRRKPTAALEPSPSVTGRSHRAQRVPFVHRSRSRQPA